jgi:hypothetical protein
MRFRNIVDMPVGFIDLFIVLIYIASDLRGALADHLAESSSHRRRPIRSAIPAIRSTACTRPRVRIASICPLYTEIALER